MTWDLEVIAKYIAPLLTTLIGIIYTAYLNRPKLIQYFGHILAHNLGDGQPIHLHTLNIANIGKKPAKNVRIGHFIKDFSLSISPSTIYQETVLPNGGKEICIPILLPKEQYTFSYLYSSSISWVNINHYVRSDEMVAEKIMVLPTRQFPKWVNFFIAAMLFTGCSTIIYLIINFLGRLLRCCY